MEEHDFDEQDLPPAPDKIGLASVKKARWVLVVLVVVVLVVLVVFVGSRRSLAGLKSSGRPVGRISTWWRPPKLPWSRVMTKNPNFFTTIYTTTISM